MRSNTFHNSLWQIAVIRPWRAQEVDDCVEITQPEAIGAIHISSALKQDSTVSDTETRAQIQQQCPDDADIEPAQLGGFIGHSTEYVDWNDSVFWKKWIVASGRVLLFITYNCKRGEEQLELPQVSQILSSLQPRPGGA
ncbi:MAG TPA: hypothetical protein VMF08_05830 [Candidatus Sulfotelmatobacter sp.]|nr:hypothetical protein [Candidatus Sulfotelmatobacter sp.]